jgi:ribosomal subunit interface protein
MAGTIHFLGGVMQLNIEGRNTEVQQSWRNLIERKLTKLERYPNEITHARVTITHGPHHQSGDNQVQVVLSVAGRTLTVKKQGAQIPTALRTALTAAEREIATYQQNRKRFVKSPARQAEVAEISLPSIPRSGSRSSTRARKTA